MGSSSTYGRLFPAFSQAFSIEGQDVPLDARQPHRYLRRGIIGNFLPSMQDENMMMLFRIFKRFNNAISRGLCGRIPASSDVPTWPHPFSIIIPDALKVYILSNHPQVIYDKVEKSHCIKIHSYKASNNASLLRKSNHIFSQAVAFHCQYAEILRQRDSFGS